MSRRRSRTDAKSVPVQHRTQRPANLGGLQAWTEESMTFSHHDVIEDESTRIVRGQFPARYVNHVKIRNQVTPEPNHITADGYTSTTSGPWNVGVVDVYGLIPNPDPYLGPAKAGAWEHVSTLFEETASIPNFLLEFGEVRDLGPQARQIFESLKKRPKGDLDHHLRTRWKQSKSLADALLLWKFGVQPLIQDVRALLTVGSYVKKRIAYLNKTHGRWVRERWATSVEVPTSFSAVPFTTTASWRQVSGRATSYQATFSVSYEIKRNLPLLSQHDFFVKGVMEALGFFNGPGTLWEAIPFSFVVDWLSDFSAYLNRYSHATISGYTYEIRNASWSVKDKCAYEVTGNFPVAGPYNVSAGNGVIERYHRRVGFPAMQGISLTSLSANQQVLLAALVRQKLPTLPVHYRK